MARMYAICIPMGFDPVLQDEREIELFVEVMSHPKRMGMTIKEIAQKFGISTATVYYKLRDKDISQRIKDRAKLAQIGELPAIYQALSDKAKAGDVRAIQLWLEYFEGWTPKDRGTPIVDSAEEKARRERIMGWLEEQAKKPKDQGPAIVVPAQHTLEVPGDVPVPPHPMAGAVGMSGQGEGGGVATPTFDQGQGEG